MLTCLHGWLKEAVEKTWCTKDTRALKRQRNGEKFATLSISLEIIPGEDEDEDDDGVDAALETVDIGPTESENEEDS